MSNIKYCLVVTTWFSFLSCNEPNHNAAEEQLQRARAYREAGEFAIARDHLEQIEPRLLSDSARWSCACLDLEINRYFNQADRIRKLAWMCYMDTAFNEYFEPYTKFNLYLSMAQSYAVENRNCEAWFFLDSARSNLLQNELPLGHLSAQAMFDELRRNVIDTTNLDLMAVTSAEMRLRFCSEQSP